MPVFCPSYLHSRVNSTVRIGTLMPTPSVSVPQMIFSKPFCLELRGVSLGAGRPEPPGGRQSGRQPGAVLCALRFAVPGGEDVVPARPAERCPLPARWQPIVERGPFSRHARLRLSHLRGDSRHAGWCGPGMTMRPGERHASEACDTLSAI